MYSPFRKKFFALLVLHALLCPTLSLHAQEGEPARTRPRRAQAQPPPTRAPDESWQVERDDDATDFNGVEPAIRIGLTTDARAVSISTDGLLLSTTESAATPEALGVARVRVEARVLPTPPPLTKKPDATVASQSKSGARPGESRAGEARTGVALRGGTQDSSQTNVRLASRASAPTRSAVVYAAGAKPIIEARAPVVFSADDEAQHPLKLNDKPYRGRLEVFANTRGALTVVNVLGLEDYVRGVVPNELSPGGFPELEALKAQSVAARTYAVANRGQFASEGFDLLPTTRSQVYGGRSTEHPLTDRAVAETRGRIIAYKGRPINALYTPTCGGHTEDAENIFGGEAVPYLRGRACAADFKEAFSPSTLRTSREPPSIREAEHSTSARDAALLATHGLKLPARLTDDWLAAPLTVEDLRSLLATVATLTRQFAPTVTPESTRPGGFSTALSIALDGESRGGVLLGKADLEYLLAFRDADEIPAANRADVAELLRSGALALYPDATLRPRAAMSRARALRAAAAALERRDLFRLQKAAARSAADGSVVLRTGGKPPDRALKVSEGAYLFRVFGPAPFAVREITLVGGEAVVYHADSRGEIDYLEVSPAPNGAASDRFSTYSRWRETMTPAEALEKLSRFAGSVGTVLDLRVRQRGVSKRVLDLEVVGTRATAHVTGGRVRTALGLREQLFVIDRAYDEAGRVTSFTFEGRGWGHGVGMCQVGAYGLARAGLSYEKILKSYYTGVGLSKLY